MNKHISRSALPAGIGAAVQPPVSRALRDMPVDIASDIRFKGKTIVSGPAVLTKVVAVVDNRQEGIVVPFSGEADSSVEIGRLHQAVSLAANSLHLMLLHLMHGRESVAARIVQAQLELIRDPAIQSLIENRIVSARQRVEDAVAYTLFHLRSVFSEMSSRRASGRFEDVEDILKRISFSLKRVGSAACGSSVHKNSLIDAVSRSAGAVLVFSVAPSVASELSALRGVRALIACEGSPISHTAIIMKSVRIPYVSGFSSELLSAARNEDVILVEPKAGVITLRPSADAVASAFKAHRERHVERHGERPAAAYRSCKKEAVKKTILVSVQATVHHRAEVDAALSFGADSIGLVRTEFCAFRNGARLSFDEQVQEYSSIIAAAQNKRVIFRTFDFSSDKTFQSISPPDRMNGFMLRRFVSQDWLYDQILAMLTAAVDAPIEILFPMMGSRADIQASIDVLDAAYNSLLLQPRFRNLARPKVGVMVELPLIGIAARSFVDLVDFVSIGTNDLVQYALAIDRGSCFSHSSEPRKIFSHVGFIALLRGLAAELDRLNVPFSVCGEMAGDPFFLPMLLAFGVRTLSVAPDSIEPIRRFCASFDCAVLSNLSQRLLSSQNSDDVMLILQECAMKCGEGVCR